MSLFLFGLAAAAADNLPMHRVRFYETGVAWFERAGPVTSETALSVPAGHLDDALKSLVVLGESVEVGAITFPSAVADDAAMTEAGLQDAGLADLESVLRSLLGSRVDVARTDGETLSGVMLDIVSLSPPEDGSAPPPYAITLLGDDGALSRVEGEQVASVKSLDPEVAGRLRRAARALGPSQAKESATIDLQMWRGGSISLGYVAEAPVFRVTYRVLVSGQGPAKLQAWALVHNDTEEDWNDTSIELANGEPDSFIHPLVAPRYAERALRLPDDGLSTVAQLVSATPDQLSGTGSYGRGIGTSGYGYGGGGLASSGLGSGVGSVGLSALAELKQAEAVETPTQFVYRVARPVDLPARHSALVPLVHDAIAVEPLTAFLPGSSEARTGLWMTNSTDRTLPEGIVSVLDGGGLAGESELARLKPKESQMLLFGNELDVELVLTQSDLPARVSGVRWQGGLAVDWIGRERYSAEIKNRSGRTRAVWLALPLGPAEDVTSGQRVCIDPQEGYSWVVLGAPEGSSTSAVEIERPFVEPHTIEDLTTEEIEGWLDARVADPGVLRDALSRRRLIDPIDEEIAALTAEASRVASSLEGLRQDLAAASDSDMLARKVAAAEEERGRLAERLSERQGERQEALSVLGEIFERLGEEP